MTAANRPSPQIQRLMASPQSQAASITIATGPAVTKAQKTVSFLNDQ